MFVSGFLHKERREVQKDPSRAIACLDQAAQRLDSFSAVHRQLSAPGQTGHAIPLLFRRLCDSLIEAAGARHIAVSLDIEPVELSFEDTILLSLLLTEIVTNALKHAFNGQDAGQIAVLFTSVAEGHVFEVRDNGRGMTGSSDSGNSGGTGHHILRLLAAQIGGTLSWTNEGGLRTRVIFPRRPGNTRTSLASALAAP
jgi:two-component sensor histidine kinase